MIYKMYATMANPSSNDPFHLERFVEAQSNTYFAALNEIRAGKKRSHWMWFVFPQLAGLGNSEFARRYAVSGRDEAVAYLQHPILGARLTEICRALLEIDGSNATQILGTPDDMKLHSCITLFLSIPVNDPSIFQAVLKKFFGGTMDRKTLLLLGNDLSVG